MGALRDEWLRIAILFSAAALVLLAVPRVRSLRAIRWVPWWLELSLWATLVEQELPRG